MLSNYTSDHRLDSSGMPAGGCTQGTGFVVSWQNGPLAVDGERRAPTGAFVETVLAAVVDRIEFYQTACDGKFACPENSKALDSIHAAQHALNRRTKRRVEAGTEGTHRGN